MIAVGVEDKKQAGSGCFSACFVIGTSLCGLVDASLPWRCTGGP